MVFFTKTIVLLWNCYKVVPVLWYFYGMVWIQWQGVNWAIVLFSFESDQIAIYCFIGNLTLKPLYIGTYFGDLHFQYFCEKCKLFGDEDLGMYHCEGCGLCRVGGRDKFFHCDICELCLPTDIKNTHKVIYTQIVTIIFTINLK